MTPLMKNVVAHTGFEPVISALRGRRPKPLDECATQELSVKFMLSGRESSSYSGSWDCSPGGTASIAAPMNAANKGCGRSGRDLNSGWN